MENKPKFTSGPWKATGDKKFVMANGLQIANIGEQYGREANAALISAAPEMYESFHKIKNILEAIKAPKDVALLVEAHKICVSMLKKAEGQP